MSKPRHMQSRFDSSCISCGTTIRKGDTFYYAGKGKAECLTCHPLPNTSQPPAANNAGGNWADALKWDAAPKPGESIGHLPKPERVNRELSDNVVSLTKQADAEVASIADRIPGAFDDVNGEPRIIAENPGSAAAHFHNFESAREEVNELNAQPDDAVAIMRDLLVAAVNAIDNADRTQRAALDSFARDMMRNAGSMSRSRVWAAIADAVNA